jgi:hypothetical protein
LEAETDEWNAGRETVDRRQETGRRTGRQARKVEGQGGVLGGRAGSREESLRDKEGELRQ